ncbi:class I SAM-dependent methyltransferase [Ferruginibacter sp.]
MDEQELRQLAAQLRQPSGQAGIQTGEWMNRGNVHINLETLKIVNAAANDTILEIGMGNGFFVKEILQKNESIQYTGVDFSDVMISEAQRINKEWIEKGQAKFILADVNALPFADNSFSKIFTINTIYFWDDPAAVLASVKRVLRPGGQFIITLRPKRQMQQYPFTRYGFTMYSKEAATLLLLQNGFSVLQAIENKEPDFELKGNMVAMEHLVMVAAKI